MNESIKVTEIFVGSTILHPKYGPCEVVEIIRMNNAYCVVVNVGDKIRNIPVTLDSFIGVPLTSDILKQYGFVHYAGNVWLKDKFTIYFFDTFARFVWGTGVSATQFECLHELQSLYVGLAGEELKPVHNAKG